MTAEKRIRTFLLDAPCQIHCSESMALPLGIYFSAQSQASLIVHTSILTLVVIHLHKDPAFAGDYANNIRGFIQFRITLGNLTYHT